MIHKIKSMKKKKIRALQNTDKIILIVTEIQNEKKQFFVRNWSVCLKQLWI